MIHKLFIFPEPLNSTCSLILDNGVSYVGIRDVHPSGRPAVSFTLPEGTPNGNGCLLNISAPTKVTLEQRGILFLSDSDGTADIVADDFHLQNEKVCPDVPPTPPTPPIPPGTIEPLDIINAVYSTGRYDLGTKDGCGKFTEECCTQLHEHNSDEWGHIKKIPPQNNYNGHAVDAIQLLAPSGDTRAGVYDLVINSESPSAKPGFGRQGDPNPALFYYPA